MTNRAKDFALFTLFGKGMQAYGLVLKDYDMRNEARMHLNRVLGAHKAFETELHRRLGSHLGEAEDEVHSELIAFIEKVYSMPEDDRDRFMQHCNQFKIETNEEAQG